VRSFGDTGRVTTILAVLAVLGPPVVVGVAGLGAPLGLAAAVPLLAAAAASRLRRIPPLPLADARRHPVLAAAWTLLLLTAAYQMTRASVFAYDPTLTQYSAVPGDAFREEHCCLTAYAEAARFASEGKPVYDVNAYLPNGQRRRIGPLTVDPFHYPPPFLFLPSAVRLVAPDLFATRRVWFALQALALGAAMLFAAWWVGGSAGRRAALLAPAVWAAPHAVLALQTGNFQTTAVAIALAGCLLASSSRPLTGGSLLAAAAAAKIFPGVVVLHVLAWARVRVMVAVAAAGLVLAVASLGVYGVETWREFVFTELPRMFSGASFPQMQLPGNAVVNLSIYGATAKLRQAGLAFLDHDAGRLIARVYMLLLVPLSVWAGWRFRRVVGTQAPFDRARLAMLWLALLNLSAFLSPFVGVAYGGFGTAWLAALMAGAAPSRRERAIAIAAFIVLTAAMASAASPRPRVAPGAGLIAVSLTSQLVALAINAWAVSAWVAATRPARVPSR
jgi:alpha-1,2-mannosyltransferase